MAMGKYISKRILLLIPVIIGISLFIFFILSIAPGDPAALILGADATEADIQAKRVEMGLDKPILVQYINYMAGVLKGDFGKSWYNGYDVMEEFLNRLPNTLQLGLMAMAISAVVGIPLGVIAAVKQYGVFDYMTLVFAMIFSSIPTFWFGLMAQIYLCIKLGLLPATGGGSFIHLILPAITLSAAQLASQVRMTRTSMLEVMKQDYVRTARAKGCSERRIVVRHVLRNGLLPVVTSLGGSFATIIGGSTVTESVFAIPGTSNMLINAVKVRDIPVVMGVLIVIAAFVGVVNLLVDILYTVIDPRVKLGT